MIKKLYKDIIFDIKNCFKYLLAFNIKTYVQFFLLLALLWLSILTIIVFINPVYDKTSVVIFPTQKAIINEIYTNTNHGYIRYFKNQNDSNPTNDISNIFYTSILNINPKKILLSKIFQAKTVSTKIALKK